MLQSFVKWNKFKIVSIDFKFDVLELSIYNDAPKEVWE